MGGVSKASKGIHLSEDIFAGFNYVLRGGESTQADYIQVTPHLFSIFCDFRFIRVETEAIGMLRQTGHYEIPSVAVKSCRFLLASLRVLLPSKLEINAVRVLLWAIGVEGA